MLELDVPTDAFPTRVLPPSHPLAAAVVAALRTVFDPEIPVNVHDIGLIYEVAFEKNSVRVAMTLTSPFCPVAGEMPEMVRAAVAAVEGVGAVAVDLVWSPPWNPDMMSDEAKLALDWY